MKKLLLGLILAPLLLLALAGVQILMYANTPHGRLDLPVAFYLQLGNWLGDAPLPHDQRDPVALRVAGEKTMRSMKGVPTPVHQVRDMLLPLDPPIPVRIYTPKASENLPVLVYFHGGGWTGGSLDSHDNVCRYLAIQANVLVVSVDWRRAPEHKFPAGLEDAYNATLWLSRHAAEVGGDPTRIAVGGDSSGGNFAAVVAQIARERKQPELSHQLLIYPATDLSDLDKPSFQKFGSGYGLTRDNVVWYRGLYLASLQQVNDPRVSPLLAEDLQGLPPATLLNAEFDVLNSDADLYASRLREAGVPVSHLTVPGVIHGFINADKLLLERSREGLDFLASNLRQAMYDRKAAASEQPNSLSTQGSY